MRSMRSVAGVAGAAFAAVALAIATAAPASAATASCRTGNTPGSTCQTSWIYANPYGHYVDYAVSGSKTCSGATWRVRDIDTGVVVRSGSVSPGLAPSGTVYGLYGRYRGEIANTIHCLFDPISISIDNV
jgi:hypothetical protein